MQLAGKAYGYPVVIADNLVFNHLGILFGQLSLNALHRRFGFQTFTDKKAQP